MKGKKDDLIKEGAMKEKSWIGLNKRKKLLDCNIENVGIERNIIRREEIERRKENNFSFIHSKGCLLFCDIISFFSTHL